MKSPLLILFSFLILFHLVSSSIVAHGLGQSFRNETGEYIVEFEYETLEVDDSSSVPYVFRLLEKQEEGPVNFDSVLVRFVLKEDKEPYLVARFIQDDLIEGLSRVTLLLPQGQYDVELNFEKDGEIFVETVFEHQVVSGDGEKKIDPKLISLGAFVLGGLLVFTFVKSKK